MLIQDEVNRLKEIHDMPNSEEKFRKLIDLADQGSVSAQSVVAKALRESDKTRALHYYRKAADGGDKAAQFEVFSILTEDKNYRLNESSEAFRNLIKSANQKYEPAVANIVAIYAGAQLGSSTKATVDVYTNPKKSLDYVKKLDGKTEHAEIQQVLELVKKYISSNYPTIYNEYYGSNQIDNNYSVYEEQRNPGCLNILLLIAAFMFPVVGMIFAIIARKRGSGVVSLIAMGYNAIFILLFLLALFTM